MSRTKRAAAPLKKKAVESFKLAVSFYNGSADEGRHTAVYMFLQHSFEMLIKAALIQSGENIVKENGQTLTLYECLDRSQKTLKLSFGEIGSIKVVDKIRNDEQHNHVVIDEAMMFLHVQAVVPIFDSILRTSFSERLGDFVPDRVVPLSTVPIQDLSLIIDTQFERVKRLLEPGSRKRDEAKAIVRGLVAMEAFFADKSDEVTENRVEEVMRGIKTTSTAHEALPKLSTIGSSGMGFGSKIAVKFTKKDDDGSIPFRFAPEGEDSILVVEKDLSKKYKFTKQYINDKFEFSNEIGKAVRWHLKLEGDEDCHRVEMHNQTKFDKYTLTAIRRIEQFLSDGETKSVLKAYRDHRKLEKEAADAEQKLLDSLTPGHNLASRKTTTVVK